MNPRRPAAGLSLEKTMGLQVFTSVQVKTENHPRFMQAGHIQVSDSPEHPTEVGVKFDVDGAVEVVDLADIKVLS